MKRNIFLAAFVLLILTVLVFSTKNNTFVNNFDPEKFMANLGRIWIQPSLVEPVLNNYPFPLLDPAITIAEGFEAYDGNLMDQKGGAHWGIDYVQKVDNRFLSFPVYSAHDGVAFQGYGKTWGKFVMIRKRDGLWGYNTLYSHLENVPKDIPYMNSDLETSKGIAIKSGKYIGDAGTSGNTKGINQLHFEFHIVNKKTGQTLRADPYGIYRRLSSGLYPSPGSSLKNIPHLWNGELPKFAEVKSL